MQTQETERGVIRLLKSTRLHVMQIAGFMTACKNLLPLIREVWRARGERENLPTNILAFLCGYLQMTVEEVDMCWAVLSEDVLRSEEEVNGYHHLMEGMWNSRDSIQRLAALNLRECIFTASTIGFSTGLDLQLLRQWQ